MCQTSDGFVFEIWHAFLCDVFKTIPTSCESYYVVIFVVSWLFRITFSMKSGSLKESINTFTYLRYWSEIWIFYTGVILGAKLFFAPEGFLFFVFVCFFFFLLISEKTTGSIRFLDIFFFISILFHTFLSVSQRVTDRRVWSMGPHNRFSHISLLSRYLLFFFGGGGCFYLSVKYFHNIFYDVFLKVFSKFHSSVQNTQIWHLTIQDL